MGRVLNALRPWCFHPSIHADFWGPFCSSGLAAEIEIHGGEYQSSALDICLYLHNGVTSVLLNGAFADTFLTDQDSFWFFSICAGLFLALLCCLRLFLSGIILGSFEGRFNPWPFLLSRTLSGFLLVRRERFAPWLWSRNTQLFCEAFLSFFFFTSQPRIAQSKSFSFSIRSALETQMETVHGTAFSYLTPFSYLICCLLGHLNYWAPSFHPPAAYMLHHCGTNYFLNLQNGKILLRII